MPPWCCVQCATRGLADSHCGSLFLWNCGVPGFAEGDDDGRVGRSSAARLSDEAIRPRLDIPRRDSSAGTSGERQKSRHDAGPTGEGQKSRRDAGATRERQKSRRDAGATRKVATVTTAFEQARQRGGAIGEHRHEFLPLLADRPLSRRDSRRCPRILAFLEQS